MQLKHTFTHKIKMNESQKADWMLLQVWDIRKVMKYFQNWTVDAESDLSTFQ